jgi:hypothetical protein
MGNPIREVVMQMWRRRAVAALALGLVGLALGCSDGAAPDDPIQSSPLLKGGGGKPVPITGVNSLSFPVIWAEGVAKTLPGTPGMDPILTGEWWYQWGTNGIDPDVTPASCPPDPDDIGFCDDGVPGSVNVSLVPGEPPAMNPLPLARVYLQKDDLNVWQAWAGDAAASGEADPVTGQLVVDSIDWGDNLESVDWYTRSQVRTEVVLFQTLTVPQLEYLMRHTSGWGIDEVHGLAADLTAVPLLGPGDRATVYTHCARLTIQKLLVSREDPDLDPQLGNLEWVPQAGWVESAAYTGDLINPAIFNKPVYEGGDGPGYYSAEINVKGRIIFGYTWNVRQLNDAIVNGGEAAGDYRITFSLDQQCGTATLNTFFVDGVTGIMVPLEEEVVVTAAEGDDGGSDTGGAVGVLDFANNLTYIDVRILERGGGK